MGRIKTVLIIKGVIIESNLTLLRRRYSTSPSTVTTTISLSAVAPFVRNLQGIALLLDDGLHINHVD